MNDSSPKRSDYACTICLDTATDPVVTKCGHLFCWVCLRKWLAIHPECPVCKGAIWKDHPGYIIPIYGSGGSDKGKSHAYTEASAASSTPMSSTAGNTNTGGSSTSHANTSEAEGRPQGVREEAPQRQRRRNAFWLPGFFFVFPMGFGEGLYIFLPILVCFGIYMLVRYLFGGSGERWRDKVNMLVVGALALVALVFCMSETLLDW